MLILFEIRGGDGQYMRPVPLCGMPLDAPVCVQTRFSGLPLVALIMTGRRFILSLTGPVSWQFSHRATYSPPSHQV